MIYYCVKSLRGDFVGATPEAVTQSFFRYAGKCADDDVMDGDHLSDRICSLFHGIAEWY